MRWIHQRERKLQIEHGVEAAVLFMVLAGYVGQRLRVRAVVSLNTIDQVATRTISYYYSSIILRLSQGAHRNHNC